MTNDWQSAINLLVPNSDGTLSVREAADFLGISRSSLSKYCVDGVGPPHEQTPGGHRRFDRGELIEWKQSWRRIPEAAQS